MRKGTNLIAFFFFAIFLAAVFIGKVFSSFGIDIGAYLTENRFKVIGAAIIFVVLVSLLQVLLAKRGKNFFVRIQFTGAQRKAPGMELNISAQDEEKAREQAREYANQMLQNDGLLGCVQVSIVECRQT